VLYLINGVRYGFLGVSDVDVSLAAGVSFGFLILFYVLGLRSLKTGSYSRW
jgi:ABC-2 type transport system permease protein